MIRLFGTILLIILLIATASVAAYAEKTYGLNVNRIVEEAGRDQGDDPDWWVNSGAYFIIEDMIGRTWFDEMPECDRWRAEYSKGINYELTEGGRFPQNLFRLVTKKRYTDYVQQVYFWIEKVNLTDTKDRDESDGVLLFNRQVSPDHLYYVGLRVDGSANWKKKDGNNNYKTLSTKRVFEGEYHRTDMPNLIPERKWIGMRSVVRTLPDGAVSLRLYIDLREGAGKWDLVLDTIDDGKDFGPVFPDGQLGIRTDYMNVRFQRYAIHSLVHDEQ